MKKLNYFLFFLSFLYFNIYYFLGSIFVGWILSGIVVSCIYHRQISHKIYQYKNNLVENISYFLIIASGQGSPLTWAYIHRLHHKYTDKEKDPQSPIIVGKLKTFFSDYKINYPETRIIRDLLQDNKIMFIHKNYNKLFVIYLLFWLVIDPIFSLYIVSGVYIWCSFFTGLLNTIAHKFKKQGPPYAQNMPCTILFWGENYHLTHHVSPYLIKHGSYDTGYFFIKIFLGKISKNK
jgi:stearoyl-CoA desaturase (delta-9 desaturase)